MANGLLDNESDDSDDESQEEENLAEVEDEEPGLRLDAVDLGEESLDIVIHNFTIAIKRKNLK